MWIDQRERDSKSGWIWGSVAFHAAIAAYFIMSSSPEHSPLPAAGATSGPITMSVVESKGSEATPTAEPVEAAQAAQPVQKEEVVKVVKPKQVTKPKAKAKKVAVVKKPKVKKQKQAVVTALPKKEVQPEEMDPQITEPKQEVSGVVIPTIDEKSLDEEVASEEAASALPAKELPQQQQQVGNGGAANQPMASGQGNAPAGSTGTSSNPRSYLDLKQKEGNVPPRYPDVARKQGVQGKVQLKYFVSEDGQVSNVQVVKSSGSSALDREAVDAIQQYQYYPGQQGWAEHPISFSLKGPQQQTPGRLRTAGSN